MDATATGSLITAFDYVIDRLTGRLGGLTDDEYFWEPAAWRWPASPTGGSARARWISFCTYSTRSSITAPRLACSEISTRTALSLAGDRIPRSVPYLTD
jgi:hypothetical protein